jgi:4-hydroxythreonine-4-phosphate dehydrogenase
MRPTLGVTAGDPAGIGPEITARALADGRLPALGRLVIFAEASTFDAATAAAGLAPLPRWTEHPEADIVLSPVDAGEAPADFRPGAATAFGGRAAAAAVEASAAAALAGRIDAIVTAPLSKTSLAKAGVTHPGHTEYFAALAGADSVAMMFVAERLRVTLATIHVPLRDVPGLLTVDGLLETMRLTRDALIRHADCPEPRLALLGLNPHAGEEGRFGDEEIRVLEPAVAAARARGWNVEGPFPADSFFARRLGEQDAVIATYHDQGLIPVKLLSGGRAVNVTLGLPFVRTSPDHGTAFDIAGQGLASSDSLVEAARLASRWAPARSSLDPGGLRP